MGKRSQQKTHVGIPILCCLLLILSGCSIFPGATNAQPHFSGTLTVSTVIPSNASPTLKVPLTISDIARGIVRNMTLDQKLGQMVIVEFYGSTLDADLMQMIQGNQVSGVLIENKNGNALTRNQLITLNQDMQKAAYVPLFISTDFEGGYVNG
jgi:beta-N-acetylhexosaminidase